MESESYGSVGTLGKYKEQYEIDKQEFVQQHQKAQEEQNGMAIFVAFPDANPAIPSNQKLAKWWESVFDDGDGKYQAGHAGVVLIDEEGDTNYFDFGRYDRPDIEDKGRGVDEGAVRSSKNYSSLRVPNWNFDNPDNVNVLNIMTKLHSSPLLSDYGTMIGALAKGLNYSAMLSYARDVEDLGYHPFGGYGSGYGYSSATYCAKFARGIGDAGGVDWDWDSYTGRANVGDIAKDYQFSILTIK